MNVSLTYDKSGFRKQRKTSNSKESCNYIALTFINVECKSEKNDDKIENLEKTDTSQEECDDEDLQ